MELRIVVGILCTPQSDYFTFQVHISNIGWCREDRVGVGWTKQEAGRTNNKLSHQSQQGMKMINKEGGRKGRRRRDGKRENENLFGCLTMFPLGWMASGWERERNDLTTRNEEQWIHLLCRLVCLQTITALGIGDG